MKTIAGSWVPKGFAAVLLALVACGEDEPRSFSSGPALVAPAQLAFAVACGAASADAVTFQLRNTGDKPLLVRSARATGGFAVSAALPIAVQPGAAVTASVRPPLADIGTDRGGSTKLGTLSLDTDDPDGVVEVALRATVHGANLEFVDGDQAVVTTLALAPQGRADCGPARSVFLRNTGDAPVTFEAVTGPFATALVGEEESLPGGGALEFSVSPDGTDACVTAGELSFAVAGSVCVAPPPLTVTQQVPEQDTCFCGSGGGSGG
jgi:hypothetical protein